MNSSAGMRDPGVYRKKHLIQLGFDDATISRMLANGDLTRLRPWWYSSRTRDETVASAVRDGGVSTCVDALTFYGLWVPPGNGGKLHLRRGRHHSGKHPACRPIVGPEYSANEPVDPIALALKYATGCLPPDEWIAVADSYMNSHRLTIGELRAELGNVGATVERWINRTNPMSQSGTESIARVRFESAGFRVVVQPPIARIGHPDMRIGRLLIECDSMLYHSNRDDYVRDRHRDRQAIIDRWLPLRLTYDDILYGWADVLADVQCITRTDRHRIRNPGGPAASGRAASLWRP